MKIMICGKGGSGKSTLSTLLARALKNRGYRILLVDGDESNMGIHRLLGGKSPVNYMDSLGGKKGFKEKRNSAFPMGSTDAVFPPNTTFDDIPKGCLSIVDGIMLLAVGKIHDFGEGCACPMGILSKAILSNLVMGEKEIVIIDSAAGVEHFGRGIDGACDMILDVVDPTFESLMLAEKMETMAREAKKPMLFVMNKVDERVEAFMYEKIDPQKVIAGVPMKNEIFTAGLEGKKISADLPELEAICDAIESKKTQFTGSISERSADHSPKTLETAAPDRQ